ncbi:alcohol dehydrogenase catalytic domain-containing protein [Dactylosporangium cerinum]|uniref:Alcohol dehydrogenase catalytic domain-containing protein n=1 Tax=Dactylosporangium cerinum TaxID=1434730 RepID=A0ABV9VVD0_9ACTN
MQALISRAGDPTPRVEQLDPRELGPDEVRVAVTAAGFTLYDAAAAADHAMLGLPDVVGLGFDFSGTVTEIGSDVAGVAVGDRVAGLHGDVTAGARAHASEVVVPATSLAPVPDTLTMEAAAAVTLSALAARQALDLLGDGRGRLLVTGGAGGVGSWAIALGVRDGWEVDALVRPGAETVALDAGASSVIAEVPSAAYDAVVDAGALQQDAVAAVRDGGRFVGVKPGRAVAAERGVTVSTVLTRPDGAALTDLLGLAAKGHAPIRIAATRPLTQAAELYAAAMAAPGSDGRWLLIP